MQHRFAVSCASFVLAVVALVAVGCYGRAVRRG